MSAQTKLAPGKLPVKQAKVDATPAKSKETEQAVSNAANSDLLQP